MAEGQDDAEKTEDPTAKRLQDAANKGDFPKSTELTGWIGLAAATVFIAAGAGPTTRALGDMLTGYFAAPHAVGLDPGGAVALFRSLSLGTLAVLAIPFAVLVAAGIFGNVAQHKPVFTAERMKPKLDKISPIKGFSRILGQQAFVNLAKGVAKMAIVAAAAFLVLWPDRDKLALLVMLTPAALFQVILEEAMKLLVAVVVVLFFVAIADVLYQRYSFMKRQRMSRREVKDEHKQMEGDPHVRARLRQIRTEKSRQRMMAAVPDASVVITNPTHFAVALKYESGKMAAPICVAKGVDLVALKIREVAEAHDVPIVENPPLARTLFAAVDIDEDIPSEHYRAVAEVIGYVWRLRRAGGRR